MYPKADIPILQLSLSRRLTLRQQLELAQDLRPLRDQGVLILGSGNITHNLGTIDWEDDAPTAAWALEFDDFIRQALERRDLPRLQAETMTQDGNTALWRLAHPRIEHYLPLLYVVGASYAEDELSFPFTGFQNGTLSMRSVKFGG